MTVTIFGLGYQAQAGKDTVANILVRKYGFKRFAFADALKDLALKVDPYIPFRDWDEDSEYLTGLSALVRDRGWEAAKAVRLADNDRPVREFLQRLGVGARQVFGDGIWVDKVMDDIESAAKQGAERFVITDVRFPNEIQAVRIRGGKAIRIDRPGYGPVNDHESEHALAGADWDAVLINGGTLEQLEAKVDYLVVWYGLK